MSIAEPRTREPVALPLSAIGSRVFAVEHPDGWAAHAAEYERPLAASALFTGLRSPAPIEFAIDSTGISAATAGELSWRDREGRPHAAEPAGRAWRWEADGHTGPIELSRHAASAARQHAGWAAWDARCPVVAERFAATTRLCWRTLGLNTVRLRSHPQTPAVVPSLFGYVGAWQWDAYFIALGLRHGHPELARDQLRLVTGAQLADGQLPDVVHDGGVLANGRDLPAADRARLLEHGSSYADAAVPLTKPPLLLWTAVQLHAVAPDDTFLAEMIDRARANHDWWYRDSVREGQPCYLHPYSSGLDDSPAFDAPAGPTPDLAAYLIAADRLLERLRPGASDPRRRARSADWLSRHTGADTVLDLLALFAAEPDHRRSEPGHQPEPEEPSPRFNEPGREPGEPSPRFSGPSHRHPGERRDLSPARAAELAAAIADPARFGGTVAVPTVNRQHPAFRAGRMWRGPVWLNTNLLLAAGLRANGFDELADVVDASGMRLVEAGGPYEYFDAATGAPALTAVPFFGWTAAIYVDLAVRLSTRELSAGELNAGSGRSAGPNR